MFEMIKLKIASAKRDKEAKKYFKNFAPEYFDELINKAERVQSFCVNDKQDDTYYHHHLPLKDKKESWHIPENWDLSPEIVEEIKALSEELASNLWNAYRASVVSYKSPYCPVYDFTLIKGKILPLWYGLPLYDAHSMHWRQELEVLTDMFYSYLDSLSEEERTAYCERFPMPAYFGGENPLCIEEYTGQWKNEK